MYALGGEARLAGKKELNLDQCPPHIPQKILKTIKTSVVYPK